MSENIKESRWVWISSDNSIQRGQISILALLEIPLATAFFWWLSSISPWPWLTLIGLMAAPVLLLRSPESIAAGKAMLQRYMENKEVSTGEAWLIGLVSIGLAVGLTYWGKQYLLLGQTGWKPFWREAMLIVGAVVFAAAAVTFSGVGVRTGEKPGVSILVLALMKFSGGRYFLVLFMLPAIILGLFVRAVFIRLWVTLRYWHSGLATLICNWRETVCVIDARHLPELLPGAGEVSTAFSLRELLRQKIEGKFHDKIFGFLFLIALTPIIYLPALLYRWNLKASAWLWGPVALLLSPALWINDEEMRSNTACWTTNGLQKILWLVLFGFCCWLLAAHLPDDVQTLFPHWVTVAYGHFPLPTLGMRYGLLVLLAICLLVLLLTAYRIRAAHGKALEGAGDFHKGYSDELKAELRRLAIPVRYWLRVNLVVITFTIWAFALQWALQRWPNQLQHVVWSWLRPWL